MNWQAFSFHARDRVSTRANQTTGAFDRSRKTVNRVEYSSVILEENHVPSRVLGEI